MGKGQKKGKGSRKNGKSGLPFQLPLGNAFSNAGAVISGGHLRYGLKFIDSLKQVRKLDGDLATIAVSERREADSRKSCHQDDG